VTEPLLSVSLAARYREGSSVLNGLSLELNSGEILGLVGQSGCGKSTLALALLRLLHLKAGRATGKVQFSGRELMDLDEREMRELRGKEIALVLQSPIASLNPALRIGTQLAETWKAHRSGSADECRREVLKALASVMLPADDDFLSRRPSELSVGQAQRVLIAMAVMHHPLLLIADEPTSALDIITQSEILALFQRLSSDLGMAILYISHDLLSVATIANRIAVMHQGSIVECSTPREIFSSPQHAYTRALVSSLPVPPSWAAAVNPEASASPRVRAQAVGRR